MHTPIPDRLSNDPTGRGLFINLQEHPDDSAGFLILADYCEERGWQFDALCFRLAARIVAEPRKSLKTILADYLGRKSVPAHVVFLMYGRWRKRSDPLIAAEHLANLICNWRRHTTGKEFE